MKTAFTFALLAGSIGSCFAACGSIVYNQNFDHHSGPYKEWTDEQVRADFPDVAFFRGNERTEVGAPPGEDGHLKVKMPEGCVGNGDGQCGMIAKAHLGVAMREATLTYKVKFDADYDWTKGGKLPGLCADKCPDGCQSVGNNDGWSVRLMWRDFGELVSYVYLPGKTARCGVDWDWDEKATPTQWHDITLYIRVNDPGQNNGIQKTWLDGVLADSRNDIKFRATDGHLIERLVFQNFHGGKDDRFKPDKTQHIWFDDILVREGECAPDGTPTEDLTAAMPEDPVAAPEATAPAEDLVPEPEEPVNEPEEPVAEDLEPEPEEIASEPEEPEEDPEDEVGERSSDGTGSGSGSGGAGLEALTTFTTKATQDVAVVEEEEEDEVVEEEEEEEEEIAGSGTTSGGGGRTRRARRKTVRTRDERGS